MSYAHRFPLTLAAALLALLGACRSSAPLPAELVGHWSGSGRVIVDWVQTTHLAFDLRVSEDGAVTGRIGDARLDRALLRSNRGGLGRALDVKTDWIVEGRLAGELIAAEHVQRESVLLPLNLKNGQLVGGLHTSGSKLKGRDGGRLSASEVVLERD